MSKEEIQADANEVIDILVSENAKLKKSLAIQSSIINQFKKERENAE